MSKCYFEGYYFKHQLGKTTVALIPGVANGQAFIQAIANEKSYNYTFPRIGFGKTIEIGSCRFGQSGIEIDSENMFGCLTYHNITPLKTDIMGPFRHFSMECRHGVISMHHTLRGNLTIEGERFNFDGGTGYIEKDSGRSFPEKYLWLQCNDFGGQSSIMVSVATIPFMGTRFTGCICAIIFGGCEYRLATYCGVKIAYCSKEKLVLSQGKYLLEIDIDSRNSAPLFAPKNGKMSAVIHESNCSAARFRFYINSKKLFDLHSENVSFEYNM